MKVILGRFMVIRGKFFIWVLSTKRGQQVSLSVNNASHDDLVFSGPFLSSVISGNSDQ